MKKMILIWILMTWISIQTKAQINDTLYQSISYQKTLIQKGRVELYGWVSYDLNWEDESGIGIIINLHNKKKRYGKNFIRPINYNNWDRHNLYFRHSGQQNRTKEFRQRFEIPPARFGISKVLQRNEY